MDAWVNPMLLYGGAALCAAVAVVAVRDGFRWQRRRRRLHARREADRDAFRSQVAAAARRGLARQHREPAWQSTRPLRVVAIADECRDVRSFYLAPPDGRPLPAYLPGQYLTFHLRPRPSGSPVVRCYSLSDRPREEAYRITVKRCRAPRNHPDALPGVGSNFLFDGVRVGDTLEAAAPAGGFVVDPEDDRPLALVAAGIGVTPILSMASAIAHAGRERDVRIVLGMRNAEEFPFRDAVAELAATPGLRVHVAYSRPGPDAAAPRDDDHHGRVTVDYLRAVLPPGERDFFVCGPPSMMHSLVPGLLSWGVAEERIHFEAFGPASVPPNVEEAALAAAAGLPVRFTRRDEDLVWPDDCRTLLELAEAAGVPIESGCRVGNCGRCATPVVEGSVKTIRPPAAATPPGQCLACISVPASPLVLDA